MAQSGIIHPRPELTMPRKVKPSSGYPYAFHQLIRYFSQPNVRSVWIPFIPRPKRIEVQTGLWEENYNPRVIARNAAQVQRFEFYDFKKALRREGREEEARTADRIRISLHDGPPPPGKCPIAGSEEALACLCCEDRDEAGAAGVAASVMDAMLAELGPMNQPGELTPEAFVKPGLDLDQLLEQKGYTEKSVALSTTISTEELLTMSDKPVVPLSTIKTTIKDNDKSGMGGMEVSFQSPTGVQCSRCVGNMGNTHCPECGGAGYLGYNK